MYTIVVANRKGGVGKTTTAQNLAAGMAILGKKVLLLDCDHQHNLTTGCGFPGEIVPSLMELLADHKLLWQEAAKVFEVKGCKKGGACVLIPASKQLAGMPSYFASEVGKEYLLKEFISRNFGNAGFDMVILDSPPSLDLITINAYIAATHVLIPVQCEAYSLAGVDMLLEDIARTTKRLNPTIKILGIVGTMFDKRKILSRDVLNDLQNRFPSMTCNSIIRDTVAIAEAPSFGKSIFDHNANGHGSADYMALTKELKKRLEA